jgi:xylulokinase
LRGAWVGLEWNHTAAHLYRAVLESVGLEYAGYQRVLRELYPSFKMDELRVTGGGAKSDFWNRIKADALQTTVRRIARDEGAPRGVAMVAGWGVGVLKDLPSASKAWIATAGAIRGRASMALHYAKRLEIYKRALVQLAGMAGRA